MFYKVATPCINYMDNQDHVVSIVLGAGVVVICIVALSLPWFVALTVAGLASGVSEFLIKEVPKDLDDYDKSEYELWEAMMNDSGKASNGSMDDIKEQYLDGEITEEEFEQKLDKLMEENPESDKEYSLSKES
jgi:hypothetical protein